jgi:hypothetical protein
MTDIIRAVQHLDAAASLIPAGGPAWGQMPRRDTYATLNREALTAGTPMPSPTHPSVALGCWLGLGPRETASGRFL